MKVEPDIYKVLDILKPERPKADPQQLIVEKVMKLIERADEATLKQILDRIGESATCPSWRLRSDQA